jgi:hypothetical protein
MEKLTIGQRILLRDVGGKLYQPPVAVNPYTKIDVQEEIDPAKYGQFATGPYFKVKILEGPFRHMEGFLPAPAISMLSPTAFQGVGLSTDMAPNATGVRYGMDTKGKDDRYVLWQEYCRHCGESPALHILPETQQKGHHNGTLEDFLRLRQAIKTAKTTLTSKLYNNLFIKSDEAEVMLGVLQAASGKVYASHSNRKDNDGFRALVESLGWVYGTVPRNPGTPILNRRLEKATNGKVDSDLQAFEYQCAAPRLIQTALRGGDYPVAMTEGYYGGKAGGHTIRSCHRCVNRVPYMLCPE